MTTEEVLRGVLTAVGALVTVGGGSAAIAYLIFQKLGSGWLDQHFKKDLESLKHDQQRQLEQLRHEINSEFSRISKVHQKEFEILPEAWHLLHVAHGSVADLVARLKFYPDFEKNMSDARFEDIVDNSPFSEVQKNELRETSNRKAYYLEAIRDIELGKARAAQIALGNYLVLNSIFLTDELRQQFRDMNQALATVISYEETDRRLTTSQFIEKTHAIWSDTLVMLPKIESAVQKRLHYDQA